MPLLGRPAHSQGLLRKGYRCFVMDDHVLYYKVQGNDVIVYGIVHGRQRPPDE
jgi:plasmid stabilization system protein ParE